MLVLAIPPGQADNTERPGDPKTELEFAKGNEWLNTQKPVRLKDLRGKVVLLDFWTYCCINCMHVIPDLKKLEAKYPSELVVIGVHSGKFANEKGTANIRDAILRYGIKHPVVNDADFQIWHTFGARGWPTIILIDPEGNIAYSVSGEGHYQELDSGIKYLIEKARKNGILKQGPAKFTPERSAAKNTVLSFPGKIAADPQQNRLFISDSGHNRVLVVNRQGKLIAVIGSGSEGKKNGSFASCQFNHPQGLFYKDNLLYIADTENHCIRRADLMAKTVSTIAGTGSSSYGEHGGKALTSGLNSPWDLCVVGDNLYIAMAGSHQIWRLDLKNKTIAPFAGNGREDIVDGPGSSATLAQPSGLTANGKKLYFADSEVSAVRSCDAENAGTVETIIGRGLFEFGDIDGAYPNARLQHPLAVLFYHDKLFVADTYNHKIKIVDPKNKTSRTLVGTGKTGKLDAQKNSSFSEPSGLAAIDDDLYIADTNNNAIRIYNLKSGTVKTLTITPGVSGSK